MIELKGRYKPHSAIIDYKSGGSHYLEIHPIYKGKLGAGKPLSKDGVISLSRHLNKINKEGKDVWKWSSKMMPSNIIHVSTNSHDTTQSLIWYCPSRLRKMNFTENLNVPDGEALQPTVIFKVECDAFGKFKGACIYATKTPVVDQDTDLFLAPYHNVKEDICMGSAKIPKFSSINDLMFKVESVFYTSRFSHTWGSKSIKGKNLNLFWKNLIEDGVSYSEFPNNVLIPMKEKVKDLIK